MGPSWIGLWGAKRVFTDGTELRSVDAAYVRESILDPARRVQVGYDMERTGVGMPSYLGVLKEHEIESLVRFIQTLRK
jgi:cytochrome c oxidase subunit 2